MARTPFQVEILSPEGEVFNDEVEMLSTRTAVGSIGVLANHQPLLALLEPAELRLYRSESDVLTFAQGEGYLQMSGNHALVLVDEVYERDQIDVGDLRERLRKVEERLSSAEDDSEEQRTAQREQRRFEAFIKMAEGPSGS
ncbi:MAG: ATP synthase epsilon chain [uncultured Rubrobacteraceae bacterium]|uniref:ATP synthase epsilon chain n=2 Tax=Actinomycetota TaxID=201174 RepID=A0A6J4RSF0_9ACTN|nr:MAG: ATP synthase epsilon chain [uncultured Rubrobacteraceae bacterium]CAA9512132.1 MAG: ATP synthase epsilon chain [uncultured Solirubrobacteraceae bacterium]